MEVLEINRGERESVDLPRDLVIRCAEGTPATIKVTKWFRSKADAEIYYNQWDPNFSENEVF
jgi:hypothetical protein